MFVISLFFYADLLTYKITPIIDYFFPNRAFQVIWCFFFISHTYHNTYRRNTKYRNVSFFQYRAALLGSTFPEDVLAWWLLMHWLQLQSTPCEALTNVWISFAWLYSQACGHPCCLCTFSYPMSSFQSTLHLICLDTALCEPPPPFSNDLLWLTLFVEGVNVRLLDHCQVSSLPHYCGFKEQDMPGIYTVGMVI